VVPRDSGQGPEEATWKEKEKITNKLLRYCMYPRPPIVDIKVAERYMGLALGNVNKGIYSHNKHEISKWLAFLMEVIIDLQETYGE
jgi:hypothetical protein